MLLVVAFLLAATPAVADLKIGRAHV